MDTRQKIISTSYQTFYQQGFHACGVDLLARQADTTKRTLYAHFGSKDGLIDAVLTYRHDDFINKMNIALDSNPTNPIQAYLDFICDWITDSDFNGCLFINASAEFGECDSNPNQHAQNHKHEIRQILKERLCSVGLHDSVTDMLFIVGEGLIVSGQTGQKDLIALKDKWVEILT